MKWSDEYKIGISVVDTQHKRLFALMAELEGELNGEVDQDVIMEILGTIDQYKIRHFQMEEKYMVDCDYPEIDGQRKAHKAFDNRFREVGILLEEKGLDTELLEAVRAELENWLKDHVTGLDVEFGRYYQEHKPQ